METVEIIGFIAAFLSAICFIPQAVRIVKTKDTNAISFWMYLISLMSVVCWLIYGIMLSSYPIIFKNIFVILISGFILVVKVIHILKKKDK